MADYCLETRAQASSYSPRTLLTKGRPGKPVTQTHVYYYVEYFVHGMVTLPVCCVQPLYYHQGRNAGLNDRTEYYYDLWLLYALSFGYMLHFRGPVGYQILPSTAID